VKKVVVTGSTSGIGLGVAYAFAKEGHKLVLNGLEVPSEVEHLLAEVKNLSGQKPLYSNADLSKEEGCKELIEVATSDGLSVDVLVNNAGVQFKAPVEHFPTEKWRFVLALNLDAPFLLSKMVLPAMYQKKWGRLIHISSVHGLVASLEKSAYVSSKHGLLGFSKVVALEAAGRGVTSNCICPGWVLTPLVEEQIKGIAQKENCSFEEAKTKLLFEKQPSKEFATPEQLGTAALFFASDHAAQVTGAHLTMDGGWTAP